jgi:LysM repeat protein
LADAAEMSVDEFKEYNPQIIAERLLVEEPEIIIYLPPNKADIYQQNIRRTGINRLSSGRSMTDEEAEQFRQTIETDTSHHRKSFVHTVKEGETLEQIAKQYNLTSSQLRSWNSIEKAIVGQELRVTKPPKKKLKQYTVRSGDTLKKIAKKHGCSVQDIRNWNGFTEEQTVEKNDVIWLKETSN